MMGDNANVYPPGRRAATRFLDFNYDQTIVLRTVGEVASSRARCSSSTTRSAAATTAGGGYNADGQATLTGQPADNGAADLIHGESGDDVIFGMTGSDVAVRRRPGRRHRRRLRQRLDLGRHGPGRRDRRRRPDLHQPQQHRRRAALRRRRAARPAIPSPKYTNGNVLDEVISTPGDIQIAIINLERRS